VVTACCKPARTERRCCACMQTRRPAMSGKACVLPLYIPDCWPCLKQTVDDAVISNLPPSPELGSRRRGTADKRFVGEEFTNSGGFLTSLLVHLAGDRIASYEPCEHLL
jgi:hypothetical protein